MSQPGKSEEGECPPGSGSLGMKPFIFYVLMDASTIQEKNPRMPKKFVKKYGDKLSSVATLVLPSGDDWLVRLREVDGKLCFTDGWYEFMVRYSICAGCLLVFKYEGGSIFNVSIFNLTSYEIDYRDKPVGIEKKFSVSNSCPPCPTFTIRSNVLEGGLDPKILCGNCISTLNSMINIDSNNLFITKDADNGQVRPQSTQDVGIQFNGNELDGIMQLLNQAGVKQTKRRKQRNEPSNLFMEMPSKKVPRMKRDVSLEAIPERERTLLSAQKFKPSNPHCCIVMRYTFVSKSFLLHIPASFASKYLHGIPEIITLEDSNGKQWPVRCISRQKTTAKLSKGWSKFVRGNQLEEGDVCVFELVEKKNVVLKVTIFRVSSHLVTSETKLQSEVVQA